jgi:hypothetical protein
MRQQHISAMKAFTPLILAGLALGGCASGPYVPSGATRVATGVLPGSVVTVPAGTKEVYYVQRGPISQTVGSMKVGPTTQPADVLVLMLLGSSERPVDVYVTSE